MPSNSISLYQDPSIKDFFKILQRASDEKRYQEYDSMLNYVEKLEHHYESIMEELQAVKQRLDELDSKNQAKPFLSSAYDNLREKMTEIGEKLNEVKQNIINATKNALDTVKEKGIGAIGSVMDFLKVKEGFNALNKLFKSGTKCAEETIARVDVMSKEYHKIGTHTRNMGRAFRGEELADDINDNGILSKSFSLPFVGMKNLFIVMSNGAESAVENLEKLSEHHQKSKENETTVEETRQPSEIKEPVIAEATPVVEVRDEQPNHVAIEEISVLNPIVISLSTNQLDLLYKSLMQLGMNGNGLTSHESSELNNLFDKVGQFTHTDEDVFYSQEQEQDMDMAL